MSFPNTKDLRVYEPLILLATLTAFACDVGTEPPDVHASPLRGDVVTESVDPCPSGVDRVIDGNSATIAGPPTSGGYELTDNDMVFATALKGPFPTTDPDYYQRAWLSPTNYDGIGPSIAYEVRGCTTDCENVDGGLQKINHHFLYSSPAEGLAFGERRYIGFALRVSRDDPTGEPILFQLWQGSPHGPPMAGRLRQELDDSLSLFVDIANNDTGSNPSASRIELGSIPDFQKDTWYSIWLSLYPEHESMEHQTGNVTLEMRYKDENDSTYSTAFSYHGKWGYVPGDGCVYANQCSTQGPNQTIDFKFGIYRPAEDTALQARFDNLKITQSGWQAEPEYVCEWSP